KEGMADGVIAVAVLRDVGRKRRRTWGASATPAPVPRSIGRTICCRGRCCTPPTRRQAAGEATNRSCGEPESFRSGLRAKDPGSSLGGSAARFGGEYGQPCQPVFSADQARNEV